MESKIQQIQLNPSQETFYGVIDQVRTPLRLDVGANIERPLIGMLILPIADLVHDTLFRMER
jgi:hypothetical protein